MSEQLSVLEPEAGASHPIHLVVTDDLERSRLTVFFRLFLALPHFVWLALWGIAVFFAVIAAWFAGIVLYLLGYVAQLVMFFAWFIALFTGHLHRGLRDVLVYWVRYTAQTYGYQLLLTRKYPSFSDE